MLSITLQIVEFVSFIALLVLVWRVSKRPRWRIRAVVYGWAAFFLLSVFWCFLMPALFSQLGFHLPVETFPDGTIMMAALVFGWFWPAIVVGISSYLERRRRGVDHVA
jgi:4-amino-4-deoxy-L-arabinose transferase-like glycosyltransferase